MFAVFRKTAFNTTTKEVLKSFLIDFDRTSASLFLDSEEHYDQLMDSSLSAEDHLILVKDLSTEPKQVLDNGHLVVRIGCGNKEITVIEAGVSTGGGNTYVVGAVIYGFITDESLGPSVNIDFFLSGDVNHINPPITTYDYINSGRRDHDVDLFAPLLESTHPFGVIVDSMLQCMVFDIPGEELIGRMVCLDRAWNESAPDYICRSKSLMFKHLSLNKDHFDYELQIRHQDLGHFEQGFIRCDDFNTSVYHAVLNRIVSEGDQYTQVMLQQYANSLLIACQATRTLESANRIMSSLVDKNITS